MRDIFLIYLLNIHPVRFIQMYDNLFDRGHLTTSIPQFPSFIPSYVYLRIVQVCLNFKYVTSK